VTVKIATGSQPFGLLEPYSWCARFPGASHAGLSQRSQPHQQVATSTTRESFDTLFISQEQAVAHLVLVISSNICPCALASVVSMGSSSR
jgi:hypothetical protein